MVHQFHAHKILTRSLITIGIHSINLNKHHTCDQSFWSWFCKNSGIFPCHKLVWTTWLQITSNNILLHIGPTRARARVNIKSYLWRIQLSICLCTSCNISSVLLHVDHTYSTLFIFITLHFRGCDKIVINGVSNDICLGFPVNSRKIWSMYIYKKKL